LYAAWRLAVFGLSSRRPKAPPGDRLPSATGKIRWEPNGNKGKGGFTGFFVVFSGSRAAHLLKLEGFARRLAIFLHQRCPIPQPSPTGWVAVRARLGL